MRIEILFLLAAASVLPARAALAATPFVNEVVDAGGQVGEYTSLALDAKGNPHVAYYDGTNDNLKYATKSGGVWTVETADGTASSLTWYCSLALDALGNPHVSYFNNTPGDLMYARKVGGVWTIESADGPSIYAGEYSSLALDAQGNVHVGYFTGNDLGYARRSGGVWTFEVADGTPASVGTWESLALDTQGNPHMVSYTTGTFDLKYAKKSTGVWTIEIVDGSANSTGFYGSIVVDAQNAVHVSYFDATTSDLRYARRLGGVWTLETADASTNQVGQFTSIALDALGNPCISYRDFTNGDLKFARKSGGSWSVEIADATENSVGEYNSLALDAQGNAYISYYDATAGDLKVANSAVHLLTPGSGVSWAVGSRQEISWAGLGPVEIALSTNGVDFDHVLASGVISSPYTLRVPHLPSRFARLRIERASPLSTAPTDSFFTINATIALESLTAAKAEGEATRVTWRSLPGPEADIRYRVERAAGDGAFLVVADGLARSEFVDSAPAADARYRLTAVNGLGEEYVLGETALAASLPESGSLAVTPSVLRGGEVTVRYRVASDRLETDASVFDLSGRLVRRLASGSLPAGVRSVTWDGRDDSGTAVGQGVYFVRLAWGGMGREAVRVTVVR